VKKETKISRGFEEECKGDIFSMVYSSSNPRKPIRCKIISCVLTAIIANTSEEDRFMFGVFL